MDYIFKIGLEVKTVIECGLILKTLIITLRFESETMAVAEPESIHTSKWQS